VSRPTLLRATVGLLALAGLVLMVFFAASPGEVRGPAVVVAPRTFRVLGGDGRSFRWVLEDQRPPQGPVVVAEGLVQPERGDPAVVELDKGMVEGREVKAGDAVAGVRGTRTEEDLAALDAGRAEAAARLALLEAGGRPETVQSARQAVSVAQAGLEQARSEQSHVEGLARQGAAPAWELEQTRLNTSISQARLDLAQANLAEARQPARPEELDQARARLAAAQARVDAAKSRAGSEEVRTLIGGTVALPGGESVVAIYEEGPRLVRVAIEEGRSAPIKVGAPLDFLPAAGGRLHGRVLAVGKEARAMNGRNIVWVVGQLEEDIACGVTGTASILPGGA